MIAPTGRDILCENIQCESSKSSTLVKFLNREWRDMKDI
jgi:hypothetical protein